MRFSAISRSEEPPRAGQRLRSSAGALLRGGRPVPAITAGSDRDHGRLFERWYTKREFRVKSCKSK